MLTQARLKELLHYDPETGLFTWVVPPSRRFKAGDPAGNISPNGYVRVKVLGVSYFGHNLAYLYMTENWPSNFLDHRDRVRSNNIWTNLRPATRTQNNRNCGKSKANSSGFKGVSFHKPTGKWRAYCGIEGNIAKHLGLFETPEEASAAYQAFAKQHQGEFFYDCPNLMGDNHLETPLS